LAEMGRRAKETARSYAKVEELNRFAAIVEEAGQIRGTGRSNPSP
jgi:hypothetical protein